jgi:tRNA A-37 threonylcarbamoyl transferase component Bud32
MTWIITPSYAASPAAHAFACLEQARATASGGEFISRSNRASCRRVTVGGQRFYVKIYDFSAKGLRVWLGRSKARTEWENLALFRSLGIATPDVVAYGETRRHGRVRSGALITAEVPSAVDLRTLAQRKDPRWADAAWRRAVLMQIADYARRLHQAGFIHNDLNWRNILVTLEGPPKVYFIDCPSGRWCPRPLRERGAAKDLAFLDKLGRQHISRTDRLRFYRYYRETGPLQAEDKRRIGRILGYLRQRFGDKYDRRQAAHTEEAKA